MNIFVTNSCPIVSAKEHCSVHQRKMIVELAQMLCTAHHVYGNPTEDMYRKTHINHPSSKWIRHSNNNYTWAYCHFKALCEAYTKSTGKVHLTDKKLSGVLSQPPAGIPVGHLTVFAKAMPDEYKGISSNPTVCYQKYLNAKYTEWLSRPKPIKVEFPLDTPSWVSDTVRNLIKQQGK